MLSVNKYGDIIIAGDYDNIIECVKPINEKEKCIIIKSNQIHAYDGYFYICEKNGQYIYINELSYQKIPLPENGIVRGSAIVLHIIDENEIDYVILCKEKELGKKTFTIPSGCCDPPEEYLDCAVREAKEESGILIDKEIDCITLVGTFKRKYYTLDDTYTNHTEIFYSKKQMTRDDMLQSIQTFDEREIEYVQPTTFDNLDHINIYPYQLYIIKKVLGLTNETINEMNGVSIDIYT